MPLYEFNCQNCEKSFEKMVRLTELEQQPECPYCASHETKRQLSKVAAFGSSLGSSSPTADRCGSSSRFT
jgi:putative FmdB family regulatory protein